MVFHPQIQASNGEAPDRFALNLGAQRLGVHHSAWICLFVQKCHRDGVFVVSVYETSFSLEMKKDSSK